MREENLTQLIIAITIVLGVVMLVDVAIDGELSESWGGNIGNILDSMVGFSV